MQMHATICNTYCTHLAHLYSEIVNVGAQDEYSVAASRVGL